MASEGTVSVYHIMEMLFTEALRDGRSRTIYGVQCRLSRGSQRIWYVNECRASWEDASRRLSGILGDPRACVTRGEHGNWVLRGAA